MPAAEPETPDDLDGALLAVPGQPPGISLDDDALHDLALDQLVARVVSTLGSELGTVLTVPLTDVAAVCRRQDVFKALDVTSTRSLVSSFSAAVESYDASHATADTTYNAVEADLWRLHAAVTYLDALASFATDLPEALSRAGTTSEALTALANLSAARVDQGSFRDVRARAAELTSAVRGVTVSLWLRGATATVGRFDDEPDDVVAVKEVFARFDDHGTPAHRVEAPRPRTSGRQMDEVQAQILTMTARLHPEVFDDVHAFAAESSRVVDQFALRFVRDARLFLTWLDVLAPLRAAGLDVCYPVVSASGGRIDAEGVYDLVLAPGLLDDHQQVVPNDLHLEESERLLVVTGPNQGGKTTFARTIGQLYHLAAVGLPVPGRRVELALSDQVLTHFERPERLENLAGRLGEGLRRMKDLLDRATDRSVIVLNEVFTSTALDDARFLTREILCRAHKIGALVICVTFIDDLATFDDATVSMVADVDPTDAASRTFHLTRRPADGLAYAQALAERHGLTARTIIERLEALA
ncbi:MAG: MutS-related protein [Cellulomonas sp.]